jgi:hypothetical protein
VVAALPAACRAFEAQGNGHETGEEYFTAHGSSIAQAHQQASAWIGQQVKIQASLLAYTEVFWTLMLISARGF